MSGKLASSALGPAGLVLFLAAAVLSARASAADYPEETLPEAITGEDLSLDEARGPKATVLICLSIDCPITTEYMPTINKIADAYQKRGVSFIGINPSGGQSLEQMADYARAQSLKFPFVKDAGGRISRRLLYSVTPEARVFDNQGKLVYSGRIDDRYRRGASKDKEVVQDLENALDEVLAGKPVSASHTRAVGCPIQIGNPAGGN